MRYNAQACPAGGDQKDIAVVMPIIENGLHLQRATLVVDDGRWDWQQRRDFRPDFVALVCVSRINDKRSVFGNYYSYYFTAVINIKIVDRFERVVATSYGEHRFQTDSPYADESCSICSGTWEGSFKIAAKLASRTLSER